MTIAVSTILSSCSKSFLTKTPNDALALSTAITSEADLKNALGGAYAILRGTNLYGRTLPVRGDLMADNEYVSSSNSGRYTAWNNFNQISTNADASGIYDYAYTGITRANEVIANTTVPTSTVVNEYKGEAYAIRALLHFELVRNFATPYTQNATNPLGVPVVNTFFGANTSPLYQPARDSVAKVYRQIISDLEQAYSMMTGYVSSGYLSKYAARALEARVYQTMGDWADAKTVALDVVTNGGFTLPSATSYPSVWSNAALTTDKVEFIFKVSADLNNNNGTDQLGYIFSQVGGYGDILCTKDLYNQYTLTDVRKALIVPATRSNISVLAINKFPNANNLADKDDIPVLRYADVLLILAEAYFNASDYTNANLYLNKVAQQRDPAMLIGYAHTGAQVLEDILLERRKEFAFEGYRLFDLLRLNRSFTKVQEESPYTSIGIMPTNNNLLLPIPQAELDLNSNMKQNPGY